MALKAADEPMLMRARRKEMTAVRAIATSGSFVRGSTFKKFTVSIDIRWIGKYL